jgi:predicted O-methyltransferase YrrM
MRKATSAERARIRTLTDGVEGFLSDHEALYLSRLAAAGPGTGAIVEIGSYHGKSTVLIAQASQAAGREKIIAIDPKKGGAIDEFHRNLARAGVTEHVTPVVATSDDAATTWQGPIRLLWIDGAHSYEQVGRDFQNWTPFLVDGGIVAFHDTYEWEGVRRVIDEHVIPDDRFALVGLVDSIAAFRKRRTLGAAERLQKTLMRRGRALYWMNGRRSLPGDLRRGLKSVLRMASATR